MTSPRLVIWSATSALAGFLFGFDTVVISGAEQTIQSLWGLSAGMHGIAMAAGALRHGGRLADRRLAGRPVRPPPDAALDRRPVLRLRGRGRDLRRTSIRSSPRGSSAGSASASRPSPRRCTSRRSRPPSSADVSPACSSSTSCFGILVAFALERAARRHRRERVAVDARRRGVSRRYLYTLLCFGIPESPRWLIGSKGDRAAGPARARQLIEPEATPARARGDGDEIARPSSEQRTRSGRFWTMRLRVPILLAFLDRVLQPALRDQRDPLLRAAHLRDDRPGRARPRFCSRSASASPTSSSRSSASG